MAATGKAAPAPNLAQCAVLNEVLKPTLHEARHCPPRQTPKHPLHGPAPAAGPSQKSQRGAPSVASHTPRFQWCVAALIPPRSSLNTIKGHQLDYWHLHLVKYFFFKCTKDTYWLSSTASEMQQHRDQLLQTQSSAPAASRGVAGRGCYGQSQTHGGWPPGCPWPWAPQWLAPTPGR